MSIRVRIAPSPTGDPHVGTAYIALFNMVFARHYQGTFILRIEDTDQTRSRKEYEEAIFEALHFCNIHWDEGPDVGGPYGPYRQSERTEIYREHAEKLVQKGYAYKCFASEAELKEMRAKDSGGYDRRYRDLDSSEIAMREKRGDPFVIRLKIPLNGECVFEDAVKGKITVPWADVDDQVLLKSDGFPTYHLANVVDDALMKISHVIRGDEWMSSTPKHIYLYEAFGWNPPTFMHMPLLLGKDGKKLSKRKNPTSIFYFRDSGYLPEALVNFLTLMGYSMPDGREIYSIDELIATFDPKRIGVSGAFFDIQKLNWLNQKTMIETIPEENLWKKISTWGFCDSFMQSLIPLVHKRMQTFGDFFSLCDFFFINDLQISKESLCPKNGSEEIASYFLQGMIWEMDTLEDWSGIGFEAASKKGAERFNLQYKKEALQILFVAIMGKTNGPSLFASVTLLGKERVRARLLKGIELLGGISNKKLSSLKKSWENSQVID